jgi:hypothetical protein
LSVLAALKDIERERSRWWHRFGHRQRLAG